MDMQSRTKDPIIYLLRFKTYPDALQNFPDALSSVFFFTGRGEIRLRSDSRITSSVLLRRLRSIH